MNETQFHAPNFKFEYDPTDTVAVKEIAKATAKIIRPGIYENIPEDIYHAMPLPSAHKLFTMRKTSPSHYWDKYLNPDAPVEKYDSNAFLIGKAFHMLILEPLAALEKIVMSPKVDMRTTVGKEIMADFKKKLKPNSLILNPEDYDRVMTMAGAFFKVDENKTNFENVKSGLNEVTLIWTEGNIKMRGRVDRIANGFIHDLKTANDVSRFSFGDAASRYGYAWQLMIYQRAWYQLTGEVLTPQITAIESERPHGTRIYSISDAILERETEMFEKIIAILSYCQTHNNWFSYNPEPEPLFTRSSYFDDRQWFDDVLEKSTYVQVDVQKRVGKCQTSSSSIASRSN